MEVLIASTISAFVILVAVSSLKAISDGAAVVTRDTEYAAEVRFAARMLDQDLANLYRDSDARAMKLVGVSQAADGDTPPSLTFYMTGRAKARADQPEGDVYEVQYTLGALPGASDADEEEDAEASMALLRRLWPNPDREREPGGILTPIAEQINVFQLQFFDGQQWVDEWSEEMQSMPELIQVTLGRLGQRRRETVLETFVAYFPRLNASRSQAPGGREAGQGEQGQRQEQGSEGSESGGPPRQMQTPTGER
jgi:type II secretion system protein J